MSRYNSRTKASNAEEMYENILDQRGVKEIIQYTTPTLSYPTEEELIRIPTVDYVWRQGDKYWRLAARHYGKANLWWVIAQFNQKPTEGHIEPGDIIKIPTDLTVVLGALS
jgi:nucleoid-associated protein YgaU|tara:strand:- start:4008 stop:4340 length:333 start_codon:yes stop_codon:yes gene_type:complete